MLQQLCLLLKFQWPYRDVHFIKPVNRAGSIPGEFCVQLKTRGRVDTLRFSSDYTHSVITDTLVSEVLILREFVFTRTVDIM